MIAFTKAAFAEQFVKTEFVKTLTRDNDRKCTVLGLAAGALVLARIDWGGLFHGDGAELGKAAGAVVAALIGYYTNRPDKTKSRIRRRR